MDYKPADAARACNASPNTIRNWCRDYAAFLSPGASGHGGDRLLTDRDMQVLQMIAQLRAEKMLLPEITARLREVTFGDIAPPGPSAPPSTLQSPQNAQDGLQQTQGVLVALQALQAQVDAIREATGQDRQQRRDNVTAFGLGFIVAGFLFLGMVLLSWLYGG